MSPAHVHVCHVAGRASRQLCPDGLVYHPSKGEGEDPCDTIHGVPDRCRGREDMQKPKPGRNTAGINTDKLLGHRANFIYILFE